MLLFRGLVIEVDFDLLKFVQNKLVLLCLILILNLDKNNNTTYFPVLVAFSLRHNISDPKVLEEYYNSTWNDVWFFVPRPQFAPPFHIVICMVWTPPQNLDTFANMTLQV